MNQCITIKCAVVPSSIVLTHKVLMGVIAKLPTCHIGEVIQFSIDLLDGRLGDPDLEADPDEVGEEAEDCHQAT